MSGKYWNIWIVFVAWSTFVKLNPMYFCFDINFQYLKFFFPTKNLIGKINNFSPRHISNQGYFRWHSFIISSWSNFNFPQQYLTLHFLPSTFSIPFVSIFLKFSNYQNIFLLSTFSADLIKTTDFSCFWSKCEKVIFSYTFSKSY